MKRGILRNTVSAALLSGLIITPGLTGCAVKVPPEITRKHGIADYPTARDFVDVLSVYDVEHGGPLYLEKEDTKGKKHKERCAGLIYWPPTSRIHIDDYYGNRSVEHTIIHEFLHALNPRMSEEDIRLFDSFAYYKYFGGIFSRNGQVLTARDVIGMATKHDVKHLEGAGFFDDESVAYITGRRGSREAKQSVIREVLRLRHRGKDFDEVMDLADRAYRELYPEVFKPAQPISTDGGSE